MSDDDLAGIIDADSEVIDEQPDYGHGADIHIPPSATGSWGGDITADDLDIDPVIGPDHGTPRRLGAHGHPATGGLSPAIAAAWAMWGDY